MFKTTVGGPPVSTAPATLEEKDALARSRKKVRKAGIAFDEEEFPKLPSMTEERKSEGARKSFRDTVSSNQPTKDAGSHLFGMESEADVDTGFASLTNHHEGITVDTSDPQKPNITLSEEEHRRLCEAFEQTLVVKQVGRTSSLAYLKRILPRMWGKKGKVSVSDVDNAYFLVGFGNMEDYMLALTGGPWTIADSYLHVSRWRPDFDPCKEVISKVAVWIRLPGISMKYFDKKFLWNVGSLIGKVLKVDMSTALRARGMFARVCVEIDLTKPLVPQYAIEGEIKRIEYESMGLLCLSCGRFGHLREKCQEQGKETSEEKVEKRAGSDIQEEGNREGPWCVVQKARRGRRLQGREESVKGKSRFAILEEEQEMMGEQGTGIINDDNKGVAQMRNRMAQGEKGETRFILQRGVTVGTNRNDNFVFRAGHSDRNPREDVIDKKKTVVWREEQNSKEWKGQRSTGVVHGHIAEAAEPDTIIGDTRMLVERVDKSSEQEDEGGTLMIMDKSSEEEDEGGTLMLIEKGKEVDKATLIPGEAVVD